MVQFLLAHPVDVECIQNTTNHAQLHMQTNTTNKNIKHLTSL